MRTRGAPSIGARAGWGHGGLGHGQTRCDLEMSQAIASTRPAETGPRCTKCGSTMIRSHVTLHLRGSISFERHAFVCIGCGHSRSYTMGGASRSDSSEVRAHEGVYSNTSRFPCGQGTRLLTSCRKIPSRTAPGRGRIEDCDPSTV